MALMQVHLTHDEYNSAVEFLRGLPEDEGRVVRLASIVANEYLDGIFRRDLTQAVVHSRALAAKAYELGLSSIAQAIAWLHDVFEDNPNITPWSIYWSAYGPCYGGPIVKGVLALTKRDWMSDRKYFRRIKEASALNWEIIVVKMIDRWHFHSDSYNGSVKKELAKIRQTRGIFLKTCKHCRKYIPTWFIPKYNKLLDDIMEAAEARYRILTNS